MGNFYTRLMHGAYVRGNIQRRIICFGLILSLGGCKIAIINLALLRPFHASVFMRISFETFFHKVISSQELPHLEFGATASFNWIVYSSVLLLTALSALQPFLQCHIVCMRTKQRESFILQRDSVICMGRSLCMLLDRHYICVWCHDVEKTKAVIQLAKLSN